MKKYYIGSDDKLPFCSAYDRVERTSDHADLDYINEASINIRARIVNLTNETIIVRDRFGLTISIEPVNPYIRRYTKREVLVFEELDFSNESYPDLSGLDGVEKELDVKCPSELHWLNINKVLDKRRGANYRSSRTGYDSSRVKGSIDYDSLISGVYLPSIDRVIYLASSASVFHHPESEMGQAIRRKAMSGKFRNFTFNIEVCDSKSSIDCRYININGEIHRIPIDRSGAKGDGIRVMYQADDNHQTFKSYTLEEGTEKLRLYTNQEAAILYGDLKSVNDNNRAKELLEAQRELENLRLKLERQKLENQEQASKIKHMEQIYESDKLRSDHERYREKTYNEYEKAKMDQEKAKMDREKSTMDHENYKEKSDMEKANQRRKYFYEFLKMIPAIVSATVTVIVLFKKVNR